MRTRTFCLGLLCLLSSAACLPAAAEIYRYTDEKGHLHFSDKPPPTKDGETRALTRQSLVNSGVSSKLRIYKFVDHKGVVHLTDQPPNGRYKLIYSGYVVDTGSKLMQERARLYTDLVEETATRHSLDAALLHAVIRVESAYNPKAVSPKGATGLMQLMPATAARYGVTDRTDPRDNLNGGAMYLKDLLKMFKYDTKLALAAYNAGENAVKKYGNKSPPYRETQGYVRKVIAFYQQYRFR